MVLLSKLVSQLSKQILPHKICKPGVFHDWLLVWVRCLSVQGDWLIPSDLRHVSG